MTFVNTTKSIICCCRSGNQPAYKQSQEEDHNDNKSDITGGPGIEDDDLQLDPFDKNPNLDEGREDEVEDVTSLSSVSPDERALPAGEENKKVAVVAATVRPTDGISDDEVVNPDDTTIVRLSTEVPTKTSNPIIHPLKPLGSGEESTREVGNETKDEAADNTIDNNGVIEKVNISTSIEALKVEEDAEELFQLEVSKSVEQPVNSSDESKASSSSKSSIQEDPIVSALSEVEFITASSNASDKSDGQFADASKNVEVEDIAVSRSISSKLEDPSTSAPKGADVEANFVSAKSSTSSVSGTPLTNASNDFEAEVEDEVIVAQCKSEDSLTSTPNEAEVDIRPPSKSSSNLSEEKLTEPSRTTSSESEEFLVNNSKSAEAISSEGNLMLRLATTSHEGEGKKDELEVSKNDSSSEAMEHSTFDTIEKAEKSQQILPDTHTPSMDSKNLSQQNLTNISLRSGDEVKEKDAGLSQNKI